MRWACPVCQAPLVLDSQGAGCEQNHRFDRAREGYINLLLANQKRSKDPGDSRQMLLARRQFLQAGYYDILAAALEREVTRCADDCSSFTLLDTGCGEGYYTARMAQTLRLVSPFSQVAGTDISREGLRIAAKANPGMEWMVASSYQLPVPPASLDMLVRVFAPGSSAETLRVLKSDGYLLVASPGPEHLRELKARLYSDAREHPAAEAPEGFSLVTETRETTQLLIDNNADVRALLAMTPLAWNGDRNARQQLEAETQLPLTADFWVSLYRRSES